jgi:hypothetical protein
MFFDAPRYESREEFRERDLAAAGILPKWFHPEFLAGAPKQTQEEVDEWKREILLGRQK